MNPTILLIDDDPEGCMLTGLILRRAGFDVYLCHRGTAALTEIDRLHPSAILMDLMMPDIDGLALCRTIRACYGPEELPIVMYTARAAVDSRRAGIEAGAQDVMIKPTPMPEFIGRLRAALEPARIAA